MLSSYTSGVASECQISLGNAIRARAFVRLTPCFCPSVGPSRVQVQPCRALQRACFRGGNAVAATPAVRHARRVVCALRADVNDQRGHGCPGPQVSQCFAPCQGEERRLGLRSAIKRVPSAQSFRADHWMRPLEIGATSLDAGSPPRHLPTT